MKFEFVIHPGGDPEDILMTFEGAENVEVIQQLGLLIVTSSIGIYVFPKPKALKIDTVNGAVELGWQPDWDLSVTGDTVRFANIGSFNPLETLVLRLGEDLTSAPVADDDNLEWSTHFGHYNEATKVVTDEDNNVIVVGTVQSSSFPVFNGVQTSLLGFRDAFIAKFDYAAAQIFATFYGGTSHETGETVCIDGGSMLVGGSTGSNNFPITPPGNGYSQGFGGVKDGFIVWLRASGTVLWSTCLGGESSDRISELAFTPSGDKLIAVGRTGSEVETSTGGATTNGGFPVRNPGGGAYYQSARAGDDDMFITQFSFPARELLWSTPFGGDDLEFGGSVVVDSDNDIIISGTTWSSIPTDNPCGVATNNGFPLCNSGEFFQGSFGGGTYDGFISRFSSNGVLEWSTYLGGDGQDEIGTGSLAVGSDGSLYVVGATTSSSTSSVCGVYSIGEFPICNPGGAYIYQGTGGQEVFITRFNQDDEIEWSTLYGGESTNDHADWNTVGGNLARQASVALDNAGNVYVGSASMVFETDDFPTSPYSNYYHQTDNAYNQQQLGLTGRFDATVVAFNSQNEREWSTLFGGRGLTAATNNSGDDIGYSVTVSGDNRLYLCGYTASDNFPYRCPAQVTNQPWCSEGNSTTNPYIEAFISRFSIEEILGVEELSSQREDLNMRIYPNPTQNSINLVADYLSGKQVSIVISNSLGQKIQQSTETPVLGVLRKQLDVSQFPLGMYFISIEGEGATHTRKFIKN